MSSNNVMLRMKRPALAPIALLVIAGLPVFGQDPSAPATQPAVGSLLDLKPDAEGKLSQQQMQQLLRVVADKDLENDKRLRDYTYIEREVEHRLDGKGQPKSTEVKT